MGLGGWMARNNWPLPWLKTELQLKISGFIIKPTYNEMINENWNICVRKFKSLLWSWDCRALDTFQQKVHVIIVFATRTLWYKAQALPLPGKIAEQFESATFRFLWRGKLEKLEKFETKNDRSKGGLQVPCIATRAEALFVRQTCRLLKNKDHNSRKHINFWIGTLLQDWWPDLGTHPAQNIPPHFRHLYNLLQEAINREVVDVNKLEYVTAKEIYKDYTTTFPTPKIMYKYDLPWDLVFARLWSTVLEPPIQSLLFLLVHNILPIRSRLHRLNMVNTDKCKDDGAVEDV